MSRWRSGPGVAATTTSVAAVLALSLLPVAPTPVPPVGAQPTEAPTVAFIGDSMGVQAQEEVVTELARTRRVTHVAVANGATMRYSLDEAQAIVGSADPPSILVVNLGHADINLLIRPRLLGRQLRAFLDVVSPVTDCVRWFDVKPGDTLFPHVNRRAPGWNRQLRTIVAEYPNVAVMHYSTWAAAAPPPLWHPDRLHFSRRGEQVFGEMVAQAADGCDPALSSGPWWDVRDDHWAAGGIAWLGTTAPRAGYNNGTYRARIGRMNVPISRLRAISDLWRLAGSPRGSVPGPWVDVPANRVDAFAWAYETGVFASNERHVRPGDPLTRAELLHILWVRVGSPRPAEAAPWPDVPPALADAFAWAYETGLLTIAPGLEVRPDAPADRALWAFGLAPPDQRGPLAPPPVTTVPESAPESIPIDITGEPTLVAPGS